MKYFLIISFLVISLIFLPANSRGADFSILGITNPIQLFEIIKREIQSLQLLVKNLNSAKSQEYQTSSKAFLAMRLSDKKVLLEKNSTETYSIASITKLMNAVIARENIDNNKDIALTAAMLEPYGDSPSLYRGLKISPENLLKASLIQSVNDAAKALAYSFGEKKFLELMNQKAKEIGMENTFFVDAHGLDPKNKSTAKDLAKLADYVYKNHSDLLDISKDNNFWLPDSSGKNLKFQNVNNFYYLPEFVGGKIGYLPEARQTSVAVFKVDNQPVAIIVLNSANRQADTLSILEKINND